MSGKLLGVTFKSKKVQELADFYKNVLGMSIEQQSNGTLCHFPGKPESASLRLVQDELEIEEEEEDKSDDRKNVYWKIGLSLADVDLARAKILEKGQEVSAPSQFLDIGYLCHTSDCEGRAIELLQHTFAANFIKPVEEPGKVLGQDALIGQITLRCSDISQSLKFYRDILGMKLLSIQEVKPYNFTLYFLAFTDESPPSDDLHSLEIREWLWKRSYTTLEIQHIPKASLQRMERKGVQCIDIKVPDKNVEDKLRNAGFDIQEKGKDFCIVNDPDFATILLHY